MTTKTICPFCDAAAVQEIRRPAKITSSRGEIKYSQIVSLCEACVGVTLSSEQSEKNRASIVAAERALVGAPEPVDIKRWRLAHGLTQDVAGRMLKVGPTAFSKYENSVMAPSGPTAVLLDTLINCYPATVHVATRAGVVLGGDVVHVQMFPNHIAWSTIADNVPCAVVMKISNMNAGTMGTLDGRAATEAQQAA